MSAIPEDCVPPAPLEPSPEATPAEAAPPVATAASVERARRSLELRSWSLALLAGFSIVAALKLGREFLVPIAESIFLGYALMPAVAALRRYARIPPALGALLALLAFLGTIFLVTAVLQPQVSRLVDAVPQVTQKLKGVLHRTALDRNSTVRRLTTAADELQKAAAPTAKGPAAAAGSPLNLREYLWSGAATVLKGFVEAAIVLALSYFLLISGQDFKRKLVRISGDSLRQKKVTVQILMEIEVQVQRYLMLQVVASALVGLLTGLAFALIGLENALFWGVAAGVLHLIPYIGPAVVIAAATMFAYLQFPEVYPVALVAGSGIVIAWTVGMVLLPWVTQRIQSLNAVATFVSLVFWDWLWGIPGLLLGVPIMIGVMAVCERIDRLQPIAEMLNSEPVRPQPGTA